MADQNATLLRMFKDWQAALQQAQASQSDALLKEAQFKGAARLVYGTDATFEYNEKTGLVFKQPDRETRRTLTRRNHAS